MKKSLILLILVFLFLSGCKKEYELPSVTPPAAATVETKAAIDLTFTFTAEAGYKMSALTATGGTATIKTSPSAGATSGNIIVTFIAGQGPGAGAVILSLKDEEDQTGNATAVISVYEEGAPVIAAPANSTVEVRKSIDLIFNFTAEGGYATSTLTATNGTASIKTNATTGATSGSVVVTFAAERTAGAGSVAISVKDNNNKTGIITGVINVTPVPTISVPNNITENTTWQTGKIYILEGRIAVTDGVTLTIEPGVIVKGNAGSGSNATALLVARGGKLIAEGTSTSPVIFTAISDQILPGEIESPNLPSTLNGLWGGLVILGKAPISADAVAVQIEGIPPSDLNGLYGGTIPDDNSGILKYISIRHGGANIGEGNEINGLTLGGVGSGTVIENIEVIANQDDGIEWFGGTVNVKNVLIWNPGDDGVDTDQSWAGSLDNFIVISGPDTDHALEIDGPEGTLIAGHTVKNGSVKGSNNELADFRAGARGSFENIYFFGFPDPAVAGEGDLSLADAASIANFAGGALSFSNLQVSTPAGVALSSVFRNGTHVHATSVEPGANTVGADKTKFSAWTWADKAGQLTSF